MSGIKKLAGAAMAAACLLAGAAGAQELPRIAVYVTGDADNNIKNALGTRMLTSLIRNGRYSANSFFAGTGVEQLKQRGGAIDNSQVVALGKQLAVRHIGIADITQAFGEYLVSARIADAATGAVVFNGETSGALGTISDLEKMSDKIVKMITEQAVLPQAQISKPEPPPIAVSIPTVPAPIQSPPADSTLKTESRPEPEPQADIAAGQAEPTEQTEKDSVAEMAMEEKRARLEELMRTKKEMEIAKAAVKDSQTIAPQAVAASAPKPLPPAIRSQPSPPPSAPVAVNKNRLEFDRNTIAFESEPLPALEPPGSTKKKTSFWKWTARISTGTLAAGGLVGGLIYNNKVVSEGERYHSTRSSWETTEARENIEKSKDRRGLCYMIAGAGAGLFTLTIVF